ncbi:MAG: hypothetical protein ACYSUD_21365 [Planctomycetota bacterium]|jgi:predicted aspartyl protease
MIEGVIRETGTPVVTLKVLGSMREITVEGILDTGFDGFLCLPIPAAITLGKYLCEIIFIHFGSEGDGCGTNVCLPEEKI